MSIPLHDIPLRNVSQLTTVFAAFLSPAVVVALSKAFVHLVNKVQQRGQQNSPLSLCLQDPWLAFNVSEPVLLPRQCESSEQSVVVLNVLIHYCKCVNHPKRFDQAGGIHPAVYCTCGSSTDYLDWGASHIQGGEGGDCGEVPPMDILLSQWSLEDQDELHHALPSSEERRFPKFVPVRKKSNDRLRGSANKIRSSTEKRKSQATMLLPEENKDEGSYLPNQHKETPHAAGYQELLRSKTRLYVETNEHTAGAELPDKVLFSNTLRSTDPIAVPAVNLDSERVPAQKFSSSRDLPSSPKRHHASRAHKQRTTEDVHLRGRGPETQTSVSYSGERTVSSHRQPSAACTGRHDAGMVGVRKSPGRARPKGHHDHAQKRPPATNTMLRESLAEPHQAVSRSSSCESFSTACCSSASSCSQKSQSDRDCTQSVHKDQRDRPGSTARQCYADRQAQDSEHHSETKSSRVPVVASPAVPGHQETTPSQTGHRNYENHDSDSTDDSEEESQDEDGMTVSLSGRVSSTVKNWLSRIIGRWSAEQDCQGQDLQSPEPIDHEFQEYDVRNVIPTNQSLWECPQIQQKTCPHSCSTSLCNIRLTLESWRKQLLMIKASLDASPGTVPVPGRCVFCREDCAGYMNCYTMQLAQQLWRMVLELKRSHFLASKCPHASQLSHEGPDDNGDEDSLQCSLGHWHACPHDYTSCLLQQLVPPSGKRCETPCVHVLLADLDQLLEKLDVLKEPSNADQLLTSQSEEGNSKDKTRQQRRACGCGRAFSRNTDTVLEGTSSHGSVRPRSGVRAEEDDLPVDNSQYKGPFTHPLSSEKLPPNNQTKMREELLENSKNARFRGEKSSLSASMSLEKEVRELEELVEFFLGNSDLIKSNLVKGKHRGNSTKPKNTINRSESKPLPVSKPPKDIAQNTKRRCTSDHNHVAVRKTQLLGKFAQHYLDHLENCLSTARASSPKLGITSRGAKDYKRQKADIKVADVENALCDLSRVLRAHTEGMGSLQPQQPMDKLPARHQQPVNQILVQSQQPVTTTEDQYAQEPVTKSQSRDQVVSVRENKADSSQQQTRYEGQNVTNKSEEGSKSSQPHTDNPKGLQPQASVIAAFKDIVVDLHKLKQNRPVVTRVQADQRVPKQAKNVKFAQLPCRRSCSVTQSSLSTSLRSESPHHPAARCSSSEGSLQALDASQKEPKVTQVFDKLDRVVDDLLKIIEVPEGEGRCNTTKKLP